MVQPLTPLVYEVVDPPTRQTTVVDLLMQVVGLIGGVIVIALLAGVLVAGFLIALRALWPQNSFNGAGTDRTRLGLSDSGPRAAS